MAVGPTEGPAVAYSKPVLVRTNVPVHFLIGTSLYWLHLLYSTVPTAVSHAGHAPQASVKSKTGILQHTTIKGFCGEPWQVTGRMYHAAADHKAVESGFRVDYAALQIW